MSPFLKLGIASSVIQSPFKLDLSKFVMKFSHCFLMSKMNVDMSPIPSFLYMNWNEIELKMLKCTLQRPFCSTLMCFYLARSTNYKPWR
jgi:hypothetical protein